MRLIVILMALVLAAGCSTDEPVKESPNLAKWNAGSAVVVVTADLAPSATVDVGALGKRPGVISASVVGSRVKLALSRQAMLVDLAALTAELTGTKGVRNVRETFTPPAD